MEELTVAHGGKEERYAALLPQIEAVLHGEHDLVARMSTVAAMLHATFGFLWTGFYRVVGDELVVGPFQGPLACLRIARHRGVCGTAWQRNETVVVPDVDAFPGHIACSSLTKSEIVVPLRVNGTVVALLDIDSAELDTFDSTDALQLEAIAAIITQEA